MPRLTAVLEQIGGFSEVTGSAQGGARAFAGLCAVSKAHFISAYASKQKKPALVIVPDEATAAKYNVARVDLDTLIKESDVVSLHVTAV